jgi:hypothetical protein
MTAEEMTTEGRMLKLVQRLHAKTKAGEIQWERTSSRDTFQSAFPNYVVRVFVRTEPEESPDYYVAIRDQAGTLIEQASDEAIDMAVPNAKAYDLMTDLYTMARRQALGVDKALDSLLGELE